MARCAVEGCESPVKARGWCEPHYLRWHRTGSVRAHEPLRKRGYKYPVRIDEMSEGEIMYCAGLFEGEGHATSRLAGNPPRPHPRLSVSMTDRDVLERFAGYTDGSSRRIVGPYFRSEENRRPMYTVRYQGEQALALAQVLYPFLGDRRRVQVADMFQAAVAYWAEREAA